MILEVTQPSNNWRWLLFNQIFLPLLMAYQASNRPFGDEVPDLIIYGLLAFGVGEALRGLALFIGYKVICRSLGRKPKADDLQPVEAPGLNAV